MENAGRVSKRAVHYLILTCAWGFVICMYSSPSKYQLPIQIRANVLLIYGLRFSNIRQQAYIHTLNLYIYICIHMSLARLNCDYQRQGVCDDFISIRLPFWINHLHLWHVTSPASLCIAISFSIRLCVSF